MAGVFAAAIALPGYGQYIHWLSEPALELGNLPNAEESQIRLSLDGSTASLQAAATNLVDAQGQPVRNLYVVDLQTGERRMAAGSARGNFSRPLAGNSRIAFTSNDAHLPDPPTGDLNVRLYIEDLGSGDVENHSDDGAGGFVNLQFNHVVRVDETATHAFFDTSSQLDPLHLIASRQLYRKTLATDSFELISVSEDGLAAADSSVFLLDVSPDGRYVVFTSDATNLVSTPINNSLGNLYLRDLQSGLTRLVNIQPDGSSSTSNEFFLFAAVSNLGNVVFASFASDLVADDTNGERDIFLYTNGLIRRLNLDPDGNELDALASLVAISADGTRVAFLEGDPAANGEPAGDETDRQLYVYDVPMDELRLVSATTADQRSNGLNLSPSLSGNGRRAAFVSEASDLAGNPFHGLYGRAYVANLVNGQIGPAVQPELPVSTIISPIFWPRMSADQRFVSFISFSPNIAQTDQGEALTGLFVLDRDSDSFQHVARAPSSHDISSSGRYVAFATDVLPPLGTVDLGVQTVFLFDRLSQSYTQIEPGGSVDGTSPRVDDSGRVVFDSEDDLLPEDGNGLRDVYLFDPQTDALTLLSADSSGQAVGGFEPDITTVGNTSFVTFTSASDSLVPGDDEGHEDVFLLTLPAGSLVRVSQAGGEGGNNDSQRPSIANGGRYVVFVSGATNLTADDYGNAGDQQVFRYDRVSGQIELASVNEAGEPLQVDFPRITSQPPSVSSSGRYVSYGFLDDGMGEDFSQDLDGRGDVVLHDFQSGESILVTATLGGSSEGIESPFTTLSNFVAEDTSVSPPRIGVVFTARDAGQLSGVYQPPDLDELFLYQFGGPPQAFDLIIDGAGSVTGNRGIDCADQCSYAFDLGAGLQLIATPDPGEQFLGWTFDEPACGDEDSPCNFAFPGEMTATARFSGGVVVDDIFADRFEGD
ncbi:MAG: hypothetical protein V2J10_00465 [Wenzhouxiangella sp.]|jgi:Tol biopolymer transport system component|nr:hypothetical protein [Wenzhouxiangella sp.]